MVKKKRAIKKKLFLSGMLLTLVASSGRTAPERLTADPVSLSPSDRILILAPHPDDEVLGCGGIIQKSVAMKRPVHVVYLTYGDNNEWSFLIYRKHPEIGRAHV